MQKFIAVVDGRHAPGGLGGACVSESVCAEVPPICAGEYTAIHGPLAAGMGGTRAQASFQHTRAPQTPRRMATVAPSATVLHTATLRFSTPQGLGGACVHAADCA